VNQTRNNYHTISQADIEKYSIWNYIPLHNSVNPEFEDVYYFTNYAVDPSLDGEQEDPEEKQ